MEYKPGMCSSKALIVSQEKEMIRILVAILNGKGVDVEITNHIEKISCDYCLVVIGPDIHTDKVFVQIKQLKGILPYFLFLENHHPDSLHQHYVSCRCKKVHLPMEIFYIEQHIEELLEIHYG